MQPLYRAQYAAQGGLMFGSTAVVLHTLVSRYRLTISPLFRLSERKIEHQHARPWTQ